MLTCGMWTAAAENLEDGRVRKIDIRRDGAPLRLADALALWHHDPGFRAFFIALLAEVPFAGYFWECPSVTAATAGRPFEFVLVDSPLLARVSPDERAFAPQFAVDASSEAIVTFANLGRDALLVAPCPRGPLTAYPHIGAFARGAPVEQQHALWRSVGLAVEQRISAEPLWLSTSGLGVHWLHVRLDSRPKYYSYQPYRRFQ